MKTYLVMAAFSDGSYRVIDRLSSGSEQEALEWAIQRNDKNCWVESEDF